MKFTETKIEECLIIEPNTFFDERGFFLESYNKKKFEEIVGKQILFRTTTHVLLEEP